MNNIENYLIAFLLGLIVGIGLSVWLIPYPTQKNKTHLVVKERKYVVHDTTLVDKPVPKETVVKDTMWLDKEDAPDFLLVEQKVYSDSLYQAWVSGVNPVLDSIKIHTRTEYVDRVIYDRVEVGQKKSQWLLGVGVESVNKELIPKANVMYQFKNIAFGCGIGIYKNSPVYDINFNYKIK